MKKITKQLLIVYLILVILKTILVYLIFVPSAFADYYIYAKMARSFFVMGGFSVHNIPTAIYPPLYPIFISISYFFSDMKVVYFFMKFINVILMTSILFPSYLLAKEFLSKKDSFLVALLISLIPSIFVFPVYIMAENLFYPLFMFFIYFLYKSFKEKNYRWDILAGIFIGLAYLTKVIAIVCLPIVLLSFIFNVMLNKKDFFIQIKKKIVLIVSALLIVLPWIIRNIKLFGFSLVGIFGSNPNWREPVAALTGKYTVEAFITLFLFYLSFLILSSGLIFFILNLSLFKRLFKKNNLSIFSSIVLSSLISSLLIAANHNSGKIKHFTLYPWLTGKFVGRYVDYIIPLILILGFIGYNYIKNDKRLIKKLVIVSSLVLLFSSQIVFVSLFPINNLSLSWLGLLNYIINFIFYKSTSFTPVVNTTVSVIFALFFLFTPFIALYIIKFPLKKVLPYFMVFFLISSLLGFMVIYYDANNIWYKTEQIQIGLFFNEYDDKVSNVLFDKRDEGILNKYKQEGIYSGSYTIIGFWMNDNITIGDIKNIENVDYIVSKHLLEYHYIYRSESGIFLYKII